VHELGGDAVSPEGLGALAPFDVVVCLLDHAAADCPAAARAFRQVPGGARAHLIAVLDGRDVDAIAAAVAAGADDILAADAPDALVGARLALAERRLAEHDEFRRSEQALRESEERLRLVYGIARGITSGASVREVIRRTLDEAATRFPHLRLTYGTIDASNKLVNTHSAGNPAMQQLAGVEADLSAAPRYLEALRKGEMLVNADIRDDPRYAEIAGDYVAIQAVAVIDVPLRHSDQLIGLVCFDYSERREWLKHEVEAVAALADFLSVAIANAAAEERRQASERARARLAAVLESTSDFVGMSDPEGRTIYLNAAGRRLVGFAADEPVEGLDISVYHPTEAARRLREVAIPHALEHGSWSGDSALRTRDGRELPTSQVVVAHRGPDGRLDFLSTIIRDMSERRRFEEQLQRTQKLESLGVLAGGIAHDFNNLLVGILGNAGLAAKELYPGAPALALVKRIETAALRAAELTKQLLAYSGKGRFVVQAIDLNRLVEEMGRLLETVVSKRVALRFRLASALPAVEADATQVRQVVMNLITNASEAIGDRDGHVTVSTSVVSVDRAYLAGAPVGADAPPGRYVALEVSDDGCGMDATTQARIFDPFFTTKFTGRGLGLAAVLGIVRGHQGAIRVYSEPGRGSAIKVLLPALAGEAPDPAPGPRPSAFHGRGTVLVVDDDMGVRLVARETCEMAGFSVEEAADGLQALERFRARPDAFAAVLLDMTMPGMDGEECFRELRRIRPDVRVILSSGYNEQDATSRFAGKGLAAFIQKPYLPDELIAKLRAVTEGRAAT
jgi:PAS domain S-box-containing protein